jgi:hypothetical protein
MKPFQQTTIKRFNSGFRAEPEARRLPAQRANLCDDGNNRRDQVCITQEDQLHTADETES